MTIKTTTTKTTRNYRVFTATIRLTEKEIEALSYSGAAREIGVLGTGMIPAVITAALEFELTNEIDEGIDVGAELEGLDARRRANLRRQVWGK